MNKCKYCGTAMDEKQNKCPSCGATEVVVDEIKKNKKSLENENKIITAFAVISIFSSLSISSILGIILGKIALKKNKQLKVKEDNAKSSIDSIARAGIILGLLTFVVKIAFVIVFIIASVKGFSMFNNYWLSPFE